LKVYPVLLGPLDEVRLDLIVDILLAFLALPFLLLLVCVRQ
jgi:hypothetical protein